jgi:hypothetical protein
MSKIQNSNLTSNLTNEEKELLVDALLTQRYALEVVGSEISDLESGRKQVDESRLKKLNDLYSRLAKAGF